MIKKWFDIFEIYPAWSRRRKRVRAKVTRANAIERGSTPNWTRWPACYLTRRRSSLNSTGSPFYGFPSVTCAPRATSKVNKKQSSFIIFSLFSSIAHRAPYWPVHWLSASFLSKTHTHERRTTECYFLLTDYTVESRRATWRQKHDHRWFRRGGGGWKKCFVFFRRRGEIAVAWNNRPISRPTQQPKRHLIYAIAMKGKKSVIITVKI